MMLPGSPPSQPASRPDWHLEWLLPPRPASVAPHTCLYFNDIRCELCLSARQACCACFYPRLRQRYFGSEEWLLFWPPFMLPHLFQSLTSRQWNLLRTSVHLLRCCCRCRSLVKNESIHYRLGLSTTKAGKAAAAGKLINSLAAALRIRHVTRNYFLCHLCWRRCLRRCLRRCCCFTINNSQRSRHRVRVGNKKRTSWQNSTPWQMDYVDSGSTFDPVEDFVY